MKWSNKAKIRVHELWKIGSGLISTKHPVLAHIVPMRRCNLACTYCNEYDDFSPPVPIEEMLRRVDSLGDLGRLSSPSAVESRRSTPSSMRSSRASESGA